MRTGAAPPVGLPAAPRGPARWVAPLLLGAPGAGACGAVDPGEAGCGVVGWFETPASVVLLNDGLLDYDPPGAEVVRRTGGWHPETGALAWTDAFDPASWRAERRVEGALEFTGGADPRDFTAEIEVVEVDRDGAEERWSLRWTREDCVAELEVLEDPGGFAPHARRVELADDLVVVRAETTWHDRPYLRTETWTPDGRRAFEVDWDDGTWVAEGVHEPDGTLSYDYVLREYDGATVYVAHVERGIDGSERLSFEARAGGEDGPAVEVGDILRARDGSGRGRWAHRDDASAPWVVCDWVTDGAGTCVLDCADGERIDCS